MAARTFGTGGYGASVYGIGVVAPPALDDLAVDAGPAPRPLHVLGVGPRTRGLAWRGAANFGRPPTVIGPGGPEIALPNPTRASFTLRRDGTCEASTEFNQPRAACWIAQELVTDLWWRRFDPRRSGTEDIQRFNADNVDTRMAGDILTTNISWVCYRELLEARVVTAADTTHPAGSSVATIFYNLIPADMNIDAEEILTTDLGVTHTEVTISQGTTIGQAVTALKDAGTAWTYWVHMEHTLGGGQPELHLSTDRSRDRGVYLIDDGTGASPVQSWQRTVNGSDYATTVVYRGDGYASIATLDATTLPAGPRDAVESGNADTQPLADAAAARVLTDRSVLRPTWSITLRPGWWEGLSHIDVGDVITVVVRLGKEVVTGRHLVEEISVDIDATGTETVTLTIGRPQLSPNPQSRNSALARIVRRIKLGT